jgi:hypothetical protein
MLFEPRAWDGQRGSASLDFATGGLGRLLGDVEDNGSLKHAIEVGPGAGFDTIGFAKSHPDFRVTGIEIDRVRVRNANDLLKVYSPDIQSRVRFVHGDALDIDPSDVDAPVSLAYSLFPAGRTNKVAEIGGATARFVDAGGEIYVLTELSASRVQDQLTGVVADNLKGRGLAIAAPVQMKQFGRSSLKAGGWDLKILLVSQQAGRSNTLFIF